MGTVMRRIQAYSIEVGDQPPVGWIPPGASEPQLTPEHKEVFDLEISREEDGFLLTWRARHSPAIGEITSGDRWYRSLDDALEGGRTRFGIPVSRWEHVAD